MAADFVVEEVLKDLFGNIAVVTTKIRDGQPSYSFQLNREFTKNDETFTTHWFQLRHIGQLRDLLDKVTAVIDRLKDRDRAASRVSR